MTRDNITSQCYCRLTSFYEMEFNTFLPVIDEAITFGVTYFHLNCIIEDPIDIIHHI